MSITPLPDAPLVSDSNTVFNAKAFALVSALDQFVNEINAEIPAIDLAVPASQAALAAANFKGDYSTLTGALSVPASCSYIGKIWVLVADTSNVVSDVPGVSAKWISAGGSVVWNGVKTASFYALAMNGYSVSTAGGAVTVTLPPTASLGDTIVLTDYAMTFGTHALTINPNGLKIDGSTRSVVITANGASVTLVYMDATQGWKAVSGFQSSPLQAAPAFSAYASSGTIVSNVTWTKIKLGAEEFDTNNNFDAATNSRFQPTVPGYYQISGMVSATGSYPQVASGIYKNGALFKTGNGFSSGDGAYYVGVSALVYLNGSTDYVELWLYQGSGAALTTDVGPSVTYFQGFLASAA